MDGGGIPTVICISSVPHPTLLIYSRNNAVWADQKDVAYRCLRCDNAQKLKRIFRVKEGEVKQYSYERKNSGLNVNPVSYQNNSLRAAEESVWKLNWSEYY